MKSYKTLTCQFQNESLINFSVTSQEQRERQLN